MHRDQDFSSLRNLLAIKRLEIPMDSEVNRFLIEFHRRQRAQLMVPASGWSRVVEWMKSLRLASSLSYGGALAAIALVAFMGLSQQVQVTEVNGTYKFSLLTPEPEMAMIPALVPAKKSPPTTFGASATTRFVLANSHPGYDASATF